MKKRSKLKIENIFILIIIIIAIVVGLTVVKPSTLLYNTYYIGGNSNEIEYYDENLKSIGKIIRGSKIKSNNKTIEKDDNTYVECIYQDDTIYINNSNIKEENKDLVMEKEIYVRTPAVIYKDTKSSDIIHQTKKGDKLEVVGYDKLIENGEVNLYKVKTGDITGYVHKKYVVLNEDEANAYYEKEKYHDYFSGMGDSLGAGNAGDLDYYPRVKPKFKDNVMPDKVYALYLNGGKDVISRVDEYIEFAKTTKINAFVVDIKDNEAPAYKSEVMKKYSETNYLNAFNSLEEYSSTIKKLKDNGFYVIGRITVFKDMYYATDNPDDAIMDTSSGQPLLHSSTYWPSPYKRDVWMFNVELAKEAVELMGFNEIQFDYVRFPDRVTNLENAGKLDYRNDYDETKSQAIQRFLMYATDELHKLNVYVAADVFGESAHKYVTAYGQFYPAISNVVDVISAMPYPDHFSTYEYGFKSPVYTQPYEILNYWAKEFAYKRREEVPTPAIDRSWIQTYDVPNYKHPGTFVYGAEQVEAEIRGLFDGGINGGYMTWNSTSSLDKYKSQKDAYSKEY